MKYENSKQVPLEELAKHVKNRGNQEKRKQKPDTAKGPNYFRDEDIERLKRAARLGGKALHVYVALRNRANRKRTNTVTLTRPVAKDFGAGKDARKEGLKRLEADGMVRVERGERRSPRVTLLV